MKGLEFPLIIKPSTGAASRGVRLASNLRMVDEQIDDNGGNM